MPGSRSFNGTSGLVNAGGAMTKPTAVSGMTVGAWIYPTGWGENNLGRVVDFNGNGLLTLSNASGELSLRGFIDYATTDTDRRAVSSFIALNTWQFVAMTWNGGTDITDLLLYKGLFGGVPAEPSSYVTITTSGGALQAFGDLCIGNRVADDRTFAGRIAHAFYINRVLTAAELAVAMYAPRLIPGLLTYHPLWGLASPEPDLSGGGHNGTVTTATAGDGGPPLGPYRRHTIGRTRGPQAVFQVSNFPYDTSLGISTSLLYDTLLGASTSFLYDAQSRVALNTHLLFDVFAGRVYVPISFPFDVSEHPNMVTVLPFDVAPSVSFTSPIKRRSVVG